MSSLFVQNDALFNWKLDVSTSKRVSMGNPSSLFVQNGALFNWKLDVNTSKRVSMGNPSSLFVQNDALFNWKLYVICYLCVSVCVCPSVPLLLWKHHEKLQEESGWSFLLSPSPLLPTIFALAVFIALLTNPLLWMNRDTCPTSATSNEKRRLPRLNVLHITSFKNYITLHHYKNKWRILRRSCGRRSTALDFPA